MCCRELKIARHLEVAGHDDLAEHLVHAALPLAAFERYAAKKPRDVERYYDECLDGAAAKKKPAAQRKSYCAAVAWSIYCKYKRPDSPHCRQTRYFADKGAP